MNKGKKWKQDSKYYFLFLSNMVLKKLSAWTFHLHFYFYKIRTHVNNFYRGNKKESFSIWLKNIFHCNVCKWILAGCNVH